MQNHYNGPKYNSLISIFTLILTHTVISAVKETKKTKGQYKEKQNALANHSRMAPTVFRTTFSRIPYKHGAIFKWIDRADMLIDQG